MALSRNERTLYSGFQPPMSYEADYDVVASARSLVCANGWKVSTGGDNCYKHFSASTNGGWTWDQARRECKSKAYLVGQSRADLTFPETKVENDLIKDLISSEDVWLGAKFTIDQLQKKNSTAIPETWENYNGWSSWRNDITPARGISTERRLLMKGDSNNKGDWVVWNGNEKKGFVCQYKKNACKPGWVEDTTTCLKAFTGEDNKMTWQNALRKCEEQGLNGTLASLRSEAIVTSLVGAQPVQTSQQQTAPSTSLQAETSAGRYGTSAGTRTTTYNAFWLGGSVQYNGGSLTYTWTDGTSQWPGKTTNHINPDAWAAGYNVPTAWVGEVNTF